MGAPAPCRGAHLSPRAGCGGQTGSVSHPASSPRQLLDRYGIVPSRALGQNFLADANTARRIARLANVSAGAAVLEIGPGLGAVTVELAAGGADVVAVEADRHLLRPLADTLVDTGVRLVHGDALSVAWEQVIDCSREWTLVANLPYNVGVPILLRILDEVPSVTRMLVMLQREVADRLVAPPRTKAYGVVTVHVAYWAVASYAGAVPASVFFPRPNVDSALVRIERRPRPAVDPRQVDGTTLLNLARRGFQQRRKMLRRVLADVASEEVFAAAGVDPTARAEELDLEQWGRLAAVVPTQERPLQ
jgi:16S rRNA (adenine1518-N6/adenine1519-N6)-dimethyltransferase